MLQSVGQSETTLPVALTRGAGAGVAALAPATRSLKSANAFVEALGRKWASLCDIYAPYEGQDQIWRYHSSQRPTEQQGWKIHLSATLPSAVDLFERCAEALVRSRCQFKVAASLNIIRKLNSGMSGRSQVGKLITVYCPDPARARALAEELHILTHNLPGPVVPSDRQFRAGSNVFYRYGAYDIFETEIDGRRVLAYRDPSGVPVPDKRTKSTAVPSWVDDPFQDHSAPDVTAPVRSTKVRYIAFKSLRWRGRGGVYLVRCPAEEDQRHCVMKEGLLHGEVGIDGRGGAHYVRNEFRTLRSIQDIIPVPRIVDFFSHDGTAYLVTEFVEGKNIDEILGNGRIPLKKGILIGRQIVGIVAALHAAGWYWRDCKTTNFLVSGPRILAIDFEFAGRIRGRPSRFAGTDGYLLEYKEVTSGRSGELQDRYALGTALHRVFAGLSDREAKTLNPLPPLPESVPSAIRDLITSLRDENPRRRASAAFAKSVFDRFA